MSNFTQVNINTVAPNPSRNFDVNPLNNEQVDTLAASMQESGDFGVIAVREAHYDYDDSKLVYEQAYGHHRLEAMQQIGLKTVEVRVMDLDDDEMIKILAQENMTQGGLNVAAAMDSLQAVVRRLAYILLITDDAESVVEISPALDMSSSGYTNAKNALLKGAGVGHALVEMYMPSVFKVDKYKQLMASMKATGIFLALVEEAQAQVEAELEAESILREEEAEQARKEEAKRVKAEKRAAAEAELLEKQIAKSKENEKKLKAKQKEQAEKQRKLMEQRQKHEQAEQAKKDKAMAILREKAAVEERKRRAKEEDAQKSREAAQAARDAAEKKANGLHLEVVHMLRTEDHLDTFRTFVTANPGDFPKDDHPMLVELIKSHAGLVNKGKVTRLIIQAVMEGELNKRNAVRRQIREDRKTYEEKASVVRAVDNAIDEFQRSLKAAYKTGLKLDKLLADDRMEDYAFRELSSNKPLVDQLSGAAALYRGMSERLRRKSFTYEVDDESIVEVV